MGDVHYFTLISEVWDQRMQWMPIVKAALILSLITLLLGFVTLFEVLSQSEIPIIIASILHGVISIAIGLFVAGHSIALLHDRREATNDHRVLSIYKKMWIGLKLLFCGLVTGLVFALPFVILSMVLVALSIILIGIVPLLFLWIYTMIFFAVIGVQFSQSYRFKDGLKWHTAYKSIRSKLGPIMIFGLVWFTINFMVFSMLSLVFVLPSYLLQLQLDIPYLIFIIQAIQGFISMCIGTLLWLAGSYGVLDLTN